MYIQPATLPARFPTAVKFEGTSYWWTGKLGTNRASGLASAEYRDDDDARVWRSADGTIAAE